MANKQVKMLSLAIKDMQTGKQNKLPLHTHQDGYTQKGI